MVRREQPAGILEFLFGEMRSALQDIRGKLLDEGWFGRRAAPPSQFEASSLGWHREPASADAGAPHRASFQEQWAARDPAASPDIAASEQGIGIDR